MAVVEWERGASCGGGELYARQWKGGRGERRAEELEEEQRLEELEEEQRLGQPELEDEELELEDELECDGWP